MAHDSLYDRFGFGSLSHSILNVRGNLYSNFCTIGGNVLANFGALNGGISGNFRNLSGTVYRLNCRGTRLVGNTGRGVDANFGNIATNLATLNARVTDYYYSARHRVRHNFYRAGCGTTAGTHSVVRATRGSASHVVTHLSRVRDAHRTRGVTTLRGRGRALGFTTSRRTRGGCLIRTLHPTPIPTFPIPTPCRFSNYNYGAYYNL